MKKSVEENIKNINKKFLQKQLYCVNFTTEDNNCVDFEINKLLLNISSVS